MEAIGCAYLDICYVKSGHHDEGDETKCGSGCEIRLILLDVCRSFRVFETEKQEPTQFVLEKQKVELFSFIFVPV